jgi:O-antigen ligase
VDTRYVIWGEAYHLFQSHPVLGIGMGNFREKYDPNVIHISSGAVDVHNLYLQLLTETGVIGLAVFLLLCGNLLKRHLKLMRQFPIGSLVYASSFAMLAVLLAVLIHGVVDFLFIGSTEFGAAFFIMLALCQSADRLIDSNKARAQYAPELRRRNTPFKAANSGAAAV